MSMTDSTKEAIGSLDKAQRVRCELPFGGRLHIDRPLPFLCVHREPTDREDAGTRDLIQGEASFLAATAHRNARGRLSSLVTAIVSAMTQEFGAFLIVEIWSAPDRDVAVAANRDDACPTELQPDFEILAHRDYVPRQTLDVLRRHLQRIVISRQSASVQLNLRGDPQPKGLPPLLKKRDARRLECAVIGLCVRPIYRDFASGELFPDVQRALKRGIGRALKQVFFTFAKSRTSARPGHVYALGRRAMVKSVWEVDRRLSEISDSFDFLLQVTPVNAEPAWREFRRSKFSRPPRFYYPPLAVEPSKLKRSLYETRIENIEDPTLGDLFRQRQDELDRKITMLKDVNSPRFLLGSRQVFGEVSESLLTAARSILYQTPSRDRTFDGGGRIDAERFRQLAEAEIEYYRNLLPSFRASVIISDDMYSGLMCSGGNLLIGHQTTIPAGRAEALIQHEVGTHLVTFYNGLAAPLQQLHSGFAGYDALQEGLAVLAEYLVGGLSRSRLRLLAARVVAVKALVDGASFLETFHCLHGEFGFSLRNSYTVTMRTFRGGGLTKDAVYLKGLIEILEYLGNGGPLDPLFIGKIAAEHIPLIQELRHRHVLKPPALLPRYLQFAGVEERLARARSGLAPIDLIRK